MPLVSREIINQIKSRREILRITQAELADLSGVGLRTIKAIESGEASPTLATLSKLADVLGMDVRLEIRKTH